MLVLSSNPFGVVLSGCWSFRGSQLPRALPHPIIFLLCCPLNDRRRAILNLFKIGRLSLLFSCLRLFHILILILLLFLMSGTIDFQACFNPTSTFLEVTFDCTLSISKYVLSFKIQVLPWSQGLTLCLYLFSEFL